MHHNLRIFSKGGPLESPVVVGVGHTCVECSIGSDCSFLVPEPFRCYFLNIFWGHVADSGGYFGPVDNSIEVGSLSGILGRNLS